MLPFAEGRRGRSKEGERQREAGREEGVPDYSSYGRFLAGHH